MIENSSKKIWISTFFQENSLLKKMRVNSTRKVILVEPVKYKDSIHAIKKDISPIPIELKKTWGKKYNLINEKITICN